MTVGRGEVLLHLLRHAHAGDPGRWSGHDDARPLSERGVGQAQALAELLAVRGILPDAIVTSPRERALRTALIVGERLGVAVVTERALAGEPGLAELAAVVAAQGGRAPMLVGHDPWISAAVCDLVGSDGLALRKGALASITPAATLRPGRGILRLLLPPDLAGPG